MDSFWQAIDNQLAELRNAGCADDVIRILRPDQEKACGDGFFAGSGGDGSVYESLRAAGWQMIWRESSFYYVMRAPCGDMITYVEGDVYRGDTARRG